MAELQFGEIPPDILYILDCCAEDDTIDAGASVALKLYGVRRTITEIIENTPVDLRGPFPWRQTIGGRLTAYAETLIAELPSARRGELAAIALIHLNHIRIATARYLASAAISDIIEGGWSQPYHRPPRGWGPDRERPYLKAQRQLASAHWIRRYVKRDDEANRIRRFAADILDRIRELPPDGIRGDISSFRSEFDAVALRQRQRHVVFSTAMGLGFDFDAAARFHEGKSTDQALQELARRAQKVLKGRRRVIKRAAKTAVSVVGTDAVSAFARGERVVIMGETAGFSVRPSGALCREGHAALNIEVLAPTREVLGELCFYIEGTPALDQLTAIGLHCAAGVEQEIIDIANVTNVTAAGVGHPLLANKSTPRIGEVRDIIIDAATNETVERRTPHEIVEMRNVAYLAETGHIWREALGVRMLGPKYLKIAERLVA